MSLPQAFGQNYVWAHVPGVIYGNYGAFSRALIPQRDQKFPWKLKRRCRIFYLGATPP